MDKVVFFDGVCNLCNSTVDFILRHDTGEEISFCPLQSERAQEELPEKLRGEDTLVYLRDGSYHTESEAYIKILRDLGGVWKIIGYLIGAFPAFLRNWAYRKVAGVRYRIFGKRDTCRRPDEDEKQRFLAWKS
jgi:predicted DCC family thiol-disulfide oxidoreductase YuxK